MPLLAVLLVAIALPGATLQENPPKPTADVPPQADALAKTAVAETPAPGTNQATAPAKPESPPATATATEDRSKTGQTLPPATTSANLSFKWMAGLVVLSALLATFVASVMADEQTQRLRNGAFGTLAGSVVGGVGALLTKQDELLLLGFLGSAVGALLGWAVSLAMSWWAATSADARTLLEYQVGGWTAVRQRLDLDEDEDLLKALDTWSRNFSRRVQEQRDNVLGLPASPTVNEFIKIVLHAWLVSCTDMLALLFTLAKKKKYRSRVTIIVFGMQGTKPIGVHWIADSGDREQHRRTRVFDTNSIGFKVLSETLPSPYLTTADKAKSEGQPRGDETYRPFLTFRLNDAAILALDWPPELKENLEEDDKYFVLMRDLFQQDLCPAIRSLLVHWSGPLANDLGLAPRAVTAPPAATPAPAPTPAPTTGPPPTPTATPTP